MLSGLAQFLNDQCNQRGLSFREASLQAGLDHGAISRFIAGTQPSRANCKKLAKFFGVSNKLVLQLAGHDTEDGDADDQSLEDLESEAVLLTAEIMKKLSSGKQWKIYKMAQMEYEEEKSLASSDDESEQSRKAS